MAVIQLHADPGFPNEVSSPKHLVFFVDDPPRQMQIFSGIAIPMWDSEKLLDDADVLVHLGVAAPAGNPPRDWDFTATTSLASISNLGAGDFTFATDECTIITEPAVIQGKHALELILLAKIHVQGDPESVLNRFSYHVEVVSNVPLTGAVRGTIRWATKYGAPTAPVLAGSQAMFQLTEDGAPPVFTTEVPQKVGDEWMVPYALLGLALDKPLVIVPELLRGALDGPPPPFTTQKFIPRSQTVTLTVSQPAVDKQDFEMYFDVLA